MFFLFFIFFFFFQAEDGIRDYKVTGVQTCALPISVRPADHRHPHAHFRAVSHWKQGFSLAGRDTGKILAQITRGLVGKNDRIAGRDILLDASVRTRRQAVTTTRTAVQEELFGDRPRRPQPIRPDLDRRLLGTGLRRGLFLLLVVFVDSFADRQDGLLEELPPTLVEVFAHSRALIPHDASGPELV